MKFQLQETVLMDWEWQRAVDKHEQTLVEFWGRYNSALRKQFKESGHNFSNKDFTAPIAFFFKNEIIHKNC